MTPWRTYADPAHLDPARSADEQVLAGRTLRDTVPFRQALTGDPTGIVVPLAGLRDIAGVGAVATDAGDVVLDVLDVDDALPGPWEWELRRAAEGLGERSVRALAEGYQEGVAAVGREALHAAKARALSVASRLARGLDGDDCAQAARRLVGKGAVPQLRPDRVAARWQRPVAGRAALADLGREFAQYRETVAEPVAALLANYRIVDALESADGRLLVLLAHGDRDVIVLEAVPAAASSWEPRAGAWREGSDVQRVLQARETVPLVPLTMLGWSTSPDGSVARAWSRARGAGRARDAAGKSGSRRRAHDAGVVLGLVHALGGDAGMLSGYLGRSGRFADALVEAVGSQA